TPHIIRIPDITEEDLAPLYVGTDQNISFASTPRIETPGTAGPFDQQRRDFPAPVPTPHAAPTPAPVNLVPNAFPNDPFRSPREAVPPQPQPTPPPQPFAMSTVPSVTFDLDPPAPVLAPGQQQVVRIRATGAGAILPSTTLSLRFDPSVVTAVGIQPFLGDNGQPDARIEPGRALGEGARGANPSGTAPVAEITLQGVAVGHSALAFENPPADQTAQNDGSVEVR